MSTPLWSSMSATTCADDSEAIARLFGVEHGDGIEARGTQRRDVAGGERDGGKYERYARKSERVGGRYSEEQSGHQVRDDERAGYTERGASGGQTEPSAQDHLEDI